VSRLPELHTLKLEDYSDRELLLVVDDLSSEGGWVDPEAVAKRLGIKAANPVRSVISRFVWMVRYGAMEREIQTDDTGSPMVTRSGRPKYGQRWRLTKGGEMLAMGKLTARQADALNRFKDDQMILVTRWLGERQRTSDDLAQTLMRREYRYSTSPLRYLNGSQPG
jgi:hypothetical protein